MLAGSSFEGLLQSLDRHFGLVEQPFGLETLSLLLQQRHLILRGKYVCALLGLLLFIYGTCLNLHLHITGAFHSFDVELLRVFAFISKDRRDLSDEACAAFGI